MRKGFTMIELIFVIVILGILAAVAIPKLTATRDDAQIAKAVYEVGMSVRDLGAYYTAQGEFNATNRSDITNVKLEEESSASSGFDFTYIYDTDNGTDCVQYDLNNSGGVVKVTKVNSASGTVCDGITSTSAWNDDINGTHTFGGGSGINF